jgi:hypothetical protein
VHRVRHRVSYLAVLPSGALHIPPFRLVRSRSPCSFHFSDVDISNIPQDPDSLLKFFILLATASEADLGFDTNIRSVGETDFDLQYTIEGRQYRTSVLLYDIGASTLTDRGTWVFEVIDQETKEVHVIKDCWLEDPPGGQMEHEIAAEIKNDMGDEKFCKHFVDISGYRRTDTSGGFNSVCKILETRTFMPEDRSEPLLLIPAPDIPKPVGSAENSVVDHRLYPTPAKRTPRNLPHPQFRYQIVYDEKGVSLFEVTSFAEVFMYLGQAAEGM